MHFSISYDRTVKIVTPVALLVLIATLLFSLLLPVDMPGPGRYLVMAVILIVMTGIICWAPKSYRVENGRLYIDKLLSPSVEIPLADVRTVGKFDRKAFKGSIRTCGSGGFLGYFGKFYHPQLGWMTWYATNLKKAVLLRTHDGKNYLLSPDDTDRFMEAFPAHQRSNEV